MTERHGYLAMSLAAEALLKIAADLLCVAWMDVMLWCDCNIAWM